jgi:hypothetical protein
MFILITIYLYKPTDDDVLMESVQKASRAIYIILSHSKKSMSLPLDPTAVVGDQDSESRLHQVAVFFAPLTS